MSVQFAAPTNMLAKGFGFRASKSNILTKPNVMSKYSMNRQQQNLTRMFRGGGLNGSRGLIDHLQYPYKASSCTLDNTNLNQSLNMLSVL